MLDPRAMPNNSSPAEQRLARFSRTCGAAYLAAAAVFALAPRLTYGLATLGADTALLPPEARFWNALAVAMEVACGVACLVVAGAPRERRHALLPVIAAKLTSSVLALAHLTRVSGPPGRALIAIALFDLPLFVLTLFVYRGAAPGVHSAAATQLPPPPEKPAPGTAGVQLGIGGPKP